MPSGCWTAVLLLVVVETQAQSGDGDTDMEPSISCFSHIMTEERSLTCQLVACRNDEDDEDVEADRIKKMTACYNNYSERRLICEEGVGDTIASRDLSVEVDLNVTAHLESGGKITAIIALTKIVKPRSPRVWNVTFNQKSGKAEIHIHTPYHKQYLKVENQLFQLLIWTAERQTIQNITSSRHVVMKIDTQSLQKNAEYYVKVRAIPWKHLQGTWSEWSERFSFVTPAGKEEHAKRTDKKQETYTLIVCLVFLLVGTSCVVLFWKNKIFTYMWPNIPHPKDTLVQICKPNKGLLLNFKPEVFSALKVYPMEKTEEQPFEETEPPAADEGTQSNHHCSTQSSDCTRSTSLSTEVLELSALLSRSSSDGEDSLQSSSPSPTNVLQLGERPHSPQPEHSSGGNETEVFGVNQQEEAYVTMSSFYQIK